MDVFLIQLKSKTYFSFSIKQFLTLRAGLVFMHCIQFWGLFHEIRGKMILSHFKPFMMVSLLWNAYKVTYKNFLIP